MSEYYPNIRIHAGFGHVVARDGLSFTFFLRRSHVDIVDAVLQSLEAYLRVVGFQSLGWYADQEGELQELDGPGWELTRRELREGRWPIIRLYDAPDGGQAYRFEYYGKDLLQGDALRDTRHATCAMSFWLPTEFLEEHGPSRVRDLALEVARPLPFCSGYGGLSFNGELDVVGVAEELAPYVLRHPGIDVLDVSSLGWKLGTRMRGPRWLTFLGQPVLGELGGPAGLRSRLRSAGTTVQPLEGDRALVTLGERPEAGDTARGDNLPSYRELARVLEPWLFFDPHRSVSCVSQEDALRWERRFLD
jgi:hypothetical protein